MIREVLQLGIKGQDLVKRTLKDIQKDKEKFSKKASFEFGKLQYKGPSDSRQKFEMSEKDKSLLSVLKAQKTAEAPQKELNYLRAQREAQSEARIKRAIEGPMHAAQGVSTLQGSTATKAMLEGVATMAGGPIGMMVAKAGGMLIDASQSFKDNVKSGAMIFADTMEAQSRTMNLVKGGGSQWLRSQRVDIDVNSQRAIVEGLGQKYGVIQDRLRKSIERIYGTGRNSTDIAQASAIAGGNFAAIGNDEGFFMQKIADQFTNMPPSIRQELTASMMDMIPSEELFKQNDKLARSNVVAFDNAERERSKQMVGEYDEKKKQYSNVQAALDIQRLTNTMDTTLNRGMGVIATKLDELIRTMANMGGGVKGRP